MFYLHKSNHLVKGHRGDPVGAIHEPHRGRLQDVRPYVGDEHHQGLILRFVGPRIHDEKLSAIRSCGILGWQVHLHEVSKSPWELGPGVHLIMKQKSVD